MKLQLWLNKSPHLLHALAIEAQIAVAGAEGGTKVDYLCLIFKLLIRLVYSTASSLENSPKRAKTPDVTGSKITATWIGF